MCREFSRNVHETMLWLSFSETVHGLKNIQFLSIMIPFSFWLLSASMWINGKDTPFFFFACSTVEHDFASSQK